MMQNSKHNQQYNPQQKHEKVKQERSAGGIIYYINENNKPIFLLLQNTLKKTYWEFPKGKIEKGEKLEETAVREAKEETCLENLQLISGFKHSLSWYFRFNGQLIRKEAVFFLLKINKENKNQVKINKEHQQFAWMDFETAMKEINIKSNKTMLKEANESILKYESQGKFS
jgi:8-oxo-dGTP pyrophosphatase MutT (NUDIX family)